MKILYSLLLLFSLLILTSCFTVKSVDNEEDKSCNLITRELEVELNQDISNGLISGKVEPKALIPLLVVVPPVSFIVSGSISVVGNALHWVEKQGRCSDDDVKAFTQKSNRAVVNDGGQIVKSSDNFAEWLKKRNAQKNTSQSIGG